MIEKADGFCLNEIIAWYPYSLPISIYLEPFMFLQATSIAIDASSNPKRGVSVIPGIQRSKVGGSTVFNTKQIFNDGLGLNRVDPPSEQINAFRTEVFENSVK